MWSANRRLAADRRGTRYVDWVGLDCYLTRPGSTYANTVALDGRRIEALSGKPILLAGTAGGARSPAHPDWRLEANHAALAAFKADVAS